MCSFKKDGCHIDIHGGRRGGQRKAWIVGLQAVIVGLKGLWTSMKGHEQSYWVLGDLEPRP